MPECGHAYVIPHGEYGFCLNCKKVVEVKEEESTTPFIMPHRIYEITEESWKKASPWPLLPYILVTEYSLYISIINGLDYLIMPILKNGVYSYYSARNISGKAGLKYSYPTGVKKLYWKSSDELTSPIIICEGVADALYCSLISSSVAVLGSYYNGSLDDDFRGKDIILCMDGDSAGVLAAFGIMQQLKGVKSKRIVMLPKNCDPTDLPIGELTKLIMGE